MRLTAPTAYWQPLTSYLAAAIENMALSLRSTIFTKLLEQDMAAFDAETCASMMSRVREDVRELRDALRSVVQRGLDNAARLVGTGIALYSISPALASSLGAPIALGLVVGNLFGSRLRKLARRSKVRTLGCGLWQSMPLCRRSHWRTPTTGRPCGCQ